MMKNRPDDPNYRKVWEMYQGICVVRGQPAVTIHEIIPRSHNIDHWMDAENRVTVCAECHENIHRTGWSTWADILRADSAQLLDKLHPDVVQ